MREWTPLAKCLRPLPEKHHGLTDVEQRYRQRYLDLLVNDEARRIALARTAIVTAVRGVLDGDGFFEVETPALQPIYGGGAARPFVTYYNEFERDFYLRIADELYLKRLIVGGLERVYEIGKDFRNEGVCVQAQPRVHDARVVRGLRGLQRPRWSAPSGWSPPRARAAGSEIDLTPPWPRIPLREAIHERAGIDPMADRDRDRLVAFMRERDIDTSGDATWAQAVDHLLSHFVEPAIERPTFLVDYPVELSPFAKASPIDPGMVERFEAFCVRHGDRERLLGAERPRRAARPVRGGARGGAPPATRRPTRWTRTSCSRSSTACRRRRASGIGIDRLTMALTGVRSIREVILFPTLRPR